MKSDDNCVAFPFLYTGVTVAVFQINGKMLSFKQRLKKTRKVHTDNVTCSFKYLLWIRSGPVALGV